MRPVGVEVEGFSAYRRAEVVDFSDAEFFSLSGPTGSGKSSLIDAMIFALYGRVPRLGGNAVAPAISAGADRARVRLDFDVDGVTHTVARLAERTKTGATVREARLERGDEVLASGADDVTRAVEELLRLRFDDFVRTVVLPQGEFARFLTAKKAERQALLRNLLGLGIYSEVRSLARSRADVAADRAESARSRLAALEVPTAADLEAAKARVAALNEVVGRVTTLEQELQARSEELKAADAETSRLADALARLRLVAPPPEMDELDGRVAEARERQEAAEESVAQAKEAEQAIREEAASLPSADTLSAARQTLEEMSRAQTRLAGLDAEGARLELAALETALSKAAERSEEANRELQETRSAHAAHSLAATLQAGDACPVCGQTVESPLDARSLPEISRLETAAQEAADARSRAGRSVEEARASLVALVTTKQELEDRVAALRASLGEMGGEAELADLTAKRERVEALLAAAVAARTGAEEALRSTQRTLDDLGDRVRSIGRALHSASRSVADLDPPVPQSDDVLIQWKELLSWVEVSIAATEQRARQAADTVEAARAKVAGAEEEIVSVFVAAGLERDSAPYSVAAARAAEDARHRVLRLQEVAAEAKELEASVAKSADEAALASALAGHLRADGFERWLMSGAIADLVAGANDLLAQLSGGGYSLHSDQDGGFSIVDHLNADEVRSVATLSGGETFLVSLALALSLAEMLASAGGSRLEAIILDEGFGTLDGESLDVVAAVLEELAGEGLMVGVITHVKELAARAPVRFEVVPDPAGSRVVGGA